MSLNKKITPYYEFNLADIEKHYDLWHAAMKNRNRDDIIAYSIKANYDPEIIAFLKKKNAFFEVCSFNEYNYLLLQNVNAKNIIYNGQIREYKHFEEMLNNNTLVLLESEKSVAYALRYRGDGEIGIRCNIDHIKKESGLFYKKESRFGISDIENVINQINKNTNLSIICLQAHCAGNSRSPDVYKLILNELCRIAINNNMPHLKCLDVGGGYKIDIRYWNEASYVDILTDVLEQNKMSNVKIIYEPGNSLVRTSGKYVTKIIDKKIINNKIFLMVDGSVVHLPFLKKGIMPTYKLPSKRKSKLFKQTIAGITCKESDIILELKNETELQVGDTIEFDNVGAYTVNEIADFLIEKPHFYYEYDTGIKIL